MMYNAKQIENNQIKITSDRLAESQLAISAGRLSTWPKQPRHEWGPNLIQDFTWRWMSSMKARSFDVETPWSFIVLCWQCFRVWDVPCGGRDQQKCVRGKPEYYGYDGKPQRYG